MVRLLRNTNILDNKLRLDCNLLNIYKKIIAEFIAYKGILTEKFYHYVTNHVLKLVASCLMLVWKCNLHSKKLLNNIVKVCSNIVGVEQKSIYNIFNHRAKKGKGYYV